MLCAFDTLCKMCDSPPGPQKNTPMLVLQERKNERTKERTKERERERERENKQTNKQTNKQKTLNELRETETFCAVNG